MLYGQKLKELEEMQRLLIVQADIHRSILRVESAALRRRLNPVSVLGQKVTGTSPWVLLGAVAGGILAFRRWRASARWVPMALTAWRWLRWWLQR